MTANVTIMPKKAGWNESAERAELHVVHCQPVTNGNKLGMNGDWLEGSLEGSNAKCKMVGTEDKTGRYANGRIGGHKYSPLEIGVYD